MATNQNDTARSGKTETLTEVLERIQRMRVRRAGMELACPLIFEDWDWLIVLQCLQDHNLFKSNPQRPPLGAFVAWVHQNDIPLYSTNCTMRSMSLANNHINGVRYPWADVQWAPHIVARWRVLYYHLNAMLHTVSICGTNAE